jgi:murein DD-endopeptidase MepM/ murein hydrolase activator NlpD
MKKLVILLALLHCPFATAQSWGSEDIGEYPITIEQINSRQGIRLVASNRGPATVTLFMNVSGDNFQPDKDLPLAAVIAPDSEQEIVRISPRDNWEPVHFTYTHVFNLGDAFMPPERDFHYQLPFPKGTRTKVVQEPDGHLITHDAVYTRYAIDFAVPQGTPVTAARAGTVIDTRDQFTEGRPDPAFSDKTNFVAIMHADHSIAYYLHLAPGGVLVLPGQRVLAGDVVAYSGNTGYTHGPHLHFDVRRASIKSGGDVIQESIPMDFYHRITGKKITLQEGMQLTTD